jgi:hypothetical protein
MSGLLQDKNIPSKCDQAITRYVCRPWSRHFPAHTAQCTLYARSRDNKDAETRHLAVSAPAPHSACVLANRMLGKMADKVQTGQSVDSHFQGAKASECAEISCRCCCAVVTGTAHVRHQLYQARNASKVAVEVAVEVAVAAVAVAVAAVAAVAVAVAAVAAVAVAVAAVAVAVAAVAVAVAAVAVAAVAVAAVVIFVRPQIICMYLHVRGQYM